MSTKSQRNHRIRATFRERRQDLNRISNGIKAANDFARVTRVPNDAFQRRSPSFSSQSWGYRPYQAAAYQAAELQTHHDAPKADHHHEDDHHTEHTHHEHEAANSADFKTSASLGGNLANRPPLTWDQANGKGSDVDITYSFAGNLNLPGLSKTEVKSLFAEALSAWSDNAPLNFQEIADPGNGRDVDIRVEGKFIDGPTKVGGGSNTLARAYFPSVGDITFDTGNQWNSSLFLETAVHELGHSVGLAHETENSAIMNPSITNRFAGKSEAFLLQDDINGIRSLYGNGKGSVRTLGQSTPPPKTTPTPEPIPEPTPTPGPMPKPRVTGRNLLANGNFEQSRVRTGQYGVFESVKGWDVLSGSGIQIDKRANTFGSAARGKSWAELDSNSNSAIGQNVDVITGKDYQVSFQYSPRQGLSAATNGIQVFWDDKLIDTVTKAGGSRNQWEKFSYGVKGGNGGSSQLSFKAVGTSDGVGGFIDNVIVKATRQQSATSRASAYQLGSSDVKADYFFPNDDITSFAATDSPLMENSTTAASAFI